MSTLANCLKDLGHDVCGYDDHQEYKYTEEGLNKRNIPIYYTATDLDPGTIVTYSKAFSLNHPELKRLMDASYTIVDYNQVVGEITKQFRSICVNGTHGKTTVSLMVAQILDCNYFVGDGSASITRDREYFVLESDEYNKHFLAYHPYISITNNIEFDHGECYPNGLEEIIDTFQTFNKKASISILNGDDLNTSKLSIEHQVYRFGLSMHNHFVAKNYQKNSAGMIFDLYYNKQFVHHFTLPFYGDYMLYNSLAAISVAYLLEIDAKEIEQKLQQFQGAKRRFKQESVKDCIVIDDYAHHPSEIKAVLAALKQKYPGKKLISVFMPNTYSRTKDLLEEFRNCFADSDYSYITPILCDREDPKDYPGITSELIVGSNNKMELLNYQDIEKLLQYDNAVIAFLSCADIKPYINQYRTLKN